jgi:hypothetical protein
VDCVLDSRWLAARGGFLLCNLLMLRFSFLVGVADQSISFLASRPCPIAADTYPESRWSYRDDWALGGSPIACPTHVKIANSIHDQVGGGISEGYMGRIKDW